MTIFLTKLLFFLSFHSPYNNAACKSTVFGTPGDKLAGGATILTKQRVKDSDLGVAHRKLKMASLVFVKVKKKDPWTLAVVLDRGPYGALDSKKNWYNAAPRFGGLRPNTKFRGCLDLTPSLAKKIGHSGGRQKVYFKSVL